LRNLARAQLLDQRQAHDIELAHRRLVDRADPMQPFGRLVDCLSDKDVPARMW
jgi:hypothetical protein